MRILLDSHAVLWWYDGATELSAMARSVIADPDNDLLVSAASAWEIATKARLGKLPKALPFARNMPEALEEQGFHLLPITVAHAHRAGWLQHRHGDPFDRMIAAQAMLENIPVLTTDQKLAALGARIIW